MNKTHVRNKEQLEEAAAKRLLRVLFWFPEIEFSLSELAEHANVSKSTASRLLGQFMRQELIMVNKNQIVYRIKANESGFEFTKMKIVYNLEFIYDSGLVEFLVSKFPSFKAIILFGSFRKGDDISTSDVDIAIETANDVGYAVVKPDGIEQIEKHFHERKIQIHLFNRDKMNINLFNNIANGIVLLGFLEVKP